MQQITIYRTHLISCHALRVDMSFCKGLETMLNCVEWVDLSIILFRHLIIKHFVCNCSLALLKDVR